jgi:hypothetical protein
VNQAIAIGLESGIVKVYDLFGNSLMEFVVGGKENTKQIIKISASPNVDDMFIGVLTSDN